MTENPYSSSLFPDDKLQGESDLSWQYVTAPLRDVAKWNRFLGYSLIAIGVLLGLTIIGVIVGWLPIWIGILFLKSADNLKAGTAYSTNEAAVQLARIIRITGVCGLALLALFLLYCVSVFVILAIYGLAAAP